MGSLVEFCPTPNHWDVDVYFGLEQRLDELDELEVTCNIESQILTSESIREVQTAL